MESILSIFMLIAAILLIAIVFIQNSKGGGISSEFGGAGQLGGVKRTNNFVEKGTFTLAAIVAVCAISLTVLNKPPKAKLPAQTKTDQSNPKKSK